VTNDHHFQGMPGFAMVGRCGRGRGRGSKKLFNATE
jgi:hypothetical protein